MRKSYFLILSVLLFVVSGCGYTTRSVLPSGDASIHVENFANKIDVTEETSDQTAYYSYIPAMESDITRDVIDKFIFDGDYRVTSPDKAHFLLKGELVGFKREPLRYDANDNVIEYRLSVLVNIQLYDLKNDELLWQEKGFAGESTYRLSGEFAKSERSALEVAIKDLARRVVERTVENW